MKSGDGLSASTSAGWKMLMSSLRNSLKPLKNGFLTLSRL